MHKSEFAQIYKNPLSLIKTFLFSDDTSLLQMKRFLINDLNNTFIEKNYLFYLMYDLYIRILLGLMHFP